VPVCEFIRKEARQVAQGDGCIAGRQSALDRGSTGWLVAFLEYFGHKTMGLGMILTDLYIVYVYIVN
jgi:hypothetical protein